MSALGSGVLLPAVVAALMATTSARTSSQFIPIDLTSLANDRMQNRESGYPLGSAVTLGAPFWIAPSGNNQWQAENAGVFNVPVSVSMSTRVQILGIARILR